MQGIPKELYKSFTMNGRIPVKYRWFDPSKDAMKKHYKIEDIRYYIERAKKRLCNYYGSLDKCLYDAFDKYPIKNKKVLVIGSAKPCYESICIHYGANVIVSEYVDVECDYPAIKYLKPHQIAHEFDAIISISSYEHSGLGRYGDPINPNGDLEAMASARILLKPEGLMFLAIPYKKDILVWNEKRVYGSIRFPKLIEGFNIIAKYGNESNQTLFILKKEEK
jgi:hypothetical protein